MARRLLLLALTLAVSVTASLAASPVKIVSGIFTYYPTDNQTRVQARDAAIENAKIELLANTFGTDVESSVLTSISSESGDNMVSLSSSQVKGEWLETIGEPELRFNTDPKTGRQAIIVTIKGKVREKSAAKVDFRAEALRNHPDLKDAATEFGDGDDLFFYFRSPADGFLTIYLYDGAGSVFRLLPYRGQTDGAWRVRADHPYYFFSPYKSDESVPGHLVDEYVLNCSGEMELNKLYIVFSPQPFVRALDEDKNPANPQSNHALVTPRELSYPDFNTWLSRIRTADERLSVKEINVTIKK